MIEKRDLTKFNLPNVNLKKLDPLKSKLIKKLVKIKVTLSRLIQKNATKKSAKFQLDKVQSINIQLSKLKFDLQKVNLTKLDPEKVKLLKFNQEEFNITNFTPEKTTSQSLI